MIQENRKNKTLYVVSRWFVGLVFLFSSFTKGVDPIGTAYKIEEYMTAWSFFGLDFTGLTGLAPVMSMAMITLEFVIGVLLITGSFRRMTAWLLVLMMAFFTFTTLYDAITNKVTDCGCFGDFLKLTNWQTFWKNVVLDVPTVYIFLCRRWKGKLKLENDSLILCLAVAAMLIFGIYNIQHDPVLDFRPWKVGNQMIDNLEEGLETTNLLTYQNKETGEYKKLDSKELMDCYAADPDWGDKWEWVGTQTISPYEVKADGFFVQDADNQDMTFDIVAATEGPVLICTIHHVDDVNDRGIKAIATAKEIAEKNDVRFVVLTCANEAEIQKLLYMNTLMPVEYYFGDEKAIETMMRSNPGFVVMRNAVVKGKWHYRQVEKLEDFAFEVNE